MTRLAYWWPALALGVVAVVGIVWAQPPRAIQAREGIEFFEAKIRPVLVKHCYECHSAKASKVRGGLYLDTRAGVLQGGDSGPAVVPGNPARSLLIKALHHDGDTKMPPKDRLPKQVVADF